MQISTSSAILHPHVINDDPFLITDIPGVLAEAGFEKIDWSLWEFCLRDNTTFEGLLTQDDWQEQIGMLRRATREAGITCGQTHCVSVNWKTYQKLDPVMLRKLEKRCTIASGMLGAECMVIHPFAPPQMTLSESISFFAEYLKPIIDLASEYKVKIAIENMIERSNQPHRFCSDVNDLYALIGHLDHPMVFACWDTGHANLSGQNQYDGITKLGDKLIALHINDNFGGNNDLHLLPYEGQIPWDQVMNALRDIRYIHDFTFEHALNHTPRHVISSQLAYMCALGHHMVERMQSDHC